MGKLALANLRVLLGVSGGIAAYKAAELTRRLRDAGAEVRVVLTENAARFVAPLTFQALCGQPVRSGLWDEAAEAAMGHIELARWAQRILRRPWAWVFEGCSCERDLAGVIGSAGFASVDITRYRMHSPFVPFNTHIAGTAIN